MSEERRFILQMVAEGKITPEEAERLLEAIEEGERTAQEAAADSFRTSSAQSGRPGDIGGSIEQAVKESLRGLDEMLRGLENKLGSKLNGVKGPELWQQVEEKMRRAAERAVYEAERAEQRAARAAERAARQAERMARRFGESAAVFGRQSPGIVQESVEWTEDLALIAQPGDRVLAESRVGDITVTFHEGAEVIVEVMGKAWGRDRQEANRRADQVQATLERRGSDIVVVDSPAGQPGEAGQTDQAGQDERAEQTEAGPHVRLDYRIRVPHGMDLALRTRVGDLKVEAGDRVGKWELETRAGDIDLEVGSNAGFRYTLETRAGETVVALDRLTVFGGAVHNGSAGDGAGEVRAVTGTGDIRLHH